MPTDPVHRTPAPVPPPSKHQLALMIWLAVLPTLIVLNLALGSLLGDTPVVLRTMIVATLAVPIVMYGLMPRLHRLRARLLAHNLPTDPGRRGRNHHDFSHHVVIRAHRERS